MKNPYEVLKQKELELAMLRRQVESLRIAIPLLAEDVDANPTPKPEGEPKP